MKNHLFSFLIETSTQKVFDFLALNPGREFIEKEIQKGTGVSKPGVNLVLKNLVKAGIVFKSKKGRMHFYKVDFKSPLVKQWKVLRNVILLMPLIKNLENEVQKIILFGSWDRGENTPDSDLDLFVLTNASRESIEKILRKISLEEKIQLIVRNPVSFSEMEKKEPIFFEEINRGLILFQKTDESRI
ncbi:MAG: hypothetical protein COV69_02805 [Parcubacteria group bacterium CG11_big_fil_rev_8_21_14_0_20_39_14]|nr:MAG: hypothetical protein COV69_02805 [Parcubacteria group bacterium CG11_big_fil_rev_8_21_14_0_20_39_14]PIS35198.1 MAG: hypothetical protein COT36_03650 [Parcubacteria group bacterium CG08_land_8_20_14_0_20_38_56]